jgi:predicted metal-dependent hydrolase
VTKKMVQVVLAPELIEAISLFNRHFFWEAHEVLERIWLEEQGELKKFYQGIIQASACCYHVLNANPKGALKLSLEAKAKLQSFAPKYLEIQIEELCQRLQDFHDEAKEILGKSKAGFSYELLPKIVIGDSLL